jgi:ABC-type polysaccharide/polyol phosphate export permease
MPFRPIPATRITVSDAIHDLIIKKDLLLALVRRELIVRYRRSILGPAWALIQPVVLMILFVMIYSFLGVKSEDAPYPVLIYSALIPWSCFSNAMVTGTYCFISNAPIIKKIYCPRELFPIANITISIIDILIPLLLFFILALHYNIKPTFNILYLPIVILIQMFVSLGFIFMAASIAVYGKDIAIGMPLIMQFWMLASPVMYESKIVPQKWKLIYMMNPMAGLINAYRNILVYGIPPNGMELLEVTLIGAAIFMPGYLIFKKIENKFADVM